MNFCRIRRRACTQSDVSPRVVWANLRDFVLEKSGYTALTSTSSTAFYGGILESRACSSNTGVPFTESCADQGMARNRRRPPEAHLRCVFSASSWLYTEQRSTHRIWVIVLCLLRYSIHLVYENVLIFYVLILLRMHSGASIFNAHLVLCKFRSYTDFAISPRSSRTAVSKRVQAERIVYSGNY